MNSAQQAKADEALTGALARAVDASHDRYVVLLQKMLQIPSPRMQEHEVIRFLGRTLEQAGCQVNLFEGQGAGEPTPAGLPINLFAARKGSGGGRSLILGAHMDSVPAGDLKKWTQGPWSGAIENGRVYGRGAHDDRSGGAIICMVIDLLNQLKVRTAGDLYILATTEEEYSCGGMKAYSRRPDRVHADAYLEIDGNSVNEAIVGLGGALSFEIRIEGPYGTTQNRKYVHDANPIELMGELIRELRRLEQELPAEAGWSDKIIAITEMKTQGWFSNVPEHCTAIGFGNVMPPLTLEMLKFIAL